MMKCQPRRLGKWLKSWKVQSDLALFLMFFVNQSPRGAFLLTWIIFISILMMENP